MSPYANNDTPKDDRPSEQERVPHLHSVVNDPTSDDSLSIDVDVALDPPTGPRSVGAEPRSSNGQLARSGVRRPADDSAVDFAEDAPQFFDRKSLETLGLPTSGPRSGEMAVDSRQAITDKTEKRDLAAHAAAMVVDPRRIPLGWMALAFIALGLVVVVALALR